MPSSKEQRAWNGSHIQNPAQFRYGTADAYGRIAKIESTIELVDGEVERIEGLIRRYGARFAIVRPAPNDPTHLDVEFRAARPFERIERALKKHAKHGIPLPEEEVNNHIKED